MKQIPVSFVVGRVGYTFDGGSITLDVREPDGTEHTIKLNQHLQDYQGAGALELDGELVAPRGALEVAILRALRSASVRGRRPVPEAERWWRSPKVKIMTAEIDEVFRASEEGNFSELLLERVISFVESDAYVELARRWGRM